MSLKIFCAIITLLSLNLVSLTDFAGKREVIGMEAFIIALVASVVGSSVGTVVGGLALHYILQKLKNKRQ